MKTSADQGLAVQAAQLKQLFSVSNLSLVTSTLLAAILAYKQSEVINPALVFTWFSIIVLIAITRSALTVLYQRSVLADSVSTEIWLAGYRLGVLLVGVSWGSAGILMFPANDPQHQMFLIFMLAGLSSGGVIAFSADLTSAIVFSISTLAPIIIRLFSTSESLMVGMGMAATLYLGFVILSLFHINRNLTENIELHLEAATREETMRISEEGYRLLLNHSPVGIFHYDSNLNITYCNECFADILHKSAKDIIGSNVEILKGQSIIPALKNALKGEMVLYEDRFYANFSVTNRWIDMTCGPSLDRTGHILGGIAIVRDITERKQADEMMRIGGIAFESQSGMIVTDSNAVILRVNRAFTAKTGYTAQDLLGMTPHIYSSGRHDKVFFQSLWNTLSETGCWQGEIWNRHKSGMVFPEWLAISAVNAPDGSVTHYVGTYADITQNQDAVAEIHRLAYYDSLTHLPNRRMLQERLGQALAVAPRHGLHGAILFLDLDNFKSLNDTRGHDAGDQLLIEVANRLRAIVSDGDIVGRLGGDEFVVLLQDLSGDDEAAAIQSKQMGEQILESLTHPYQLEGYEFQCSASIGIRLFRDQGTVEELLRHADIAMYQAKTTGGKSLCFFDPIMQTMVTARAEMDKDLRNALEKQQFKLYFQPQVDDNFHIIGAEVLLRWQHPEQGLISPLDFIPVAEKTSLILPIGQWVLETVYDQLKIWESNSLASHIQLAVNVSTRQFRQPDFVARIQQALSRKGISPALLKLELTESLVLDNIEDTIVKMLALKDIGVRFSLDDFGTGYSSFSYLTQLPLDQLKIDRSFVNNIGRQPTDAIIVQTILGMAQNLGLEVIAEGVETEAQRSFLEQHGCSIYQGYLFSEPLTVEEFELLIGQKCQQL
jgi:diguanylate cyclase (GGDEF)-like protein/PAS domain S-box-containing protein